MSEPPIEPPPPPVEHQAQVEIATDLVVALGLFPSGSPDPDTIEIIDLTDEQWATIQSSGPGSIYIDDAGVITVTPPPPPPPRFTGLASIPESRLQTTDDQPQEILRWPCEQRRLYQANLTISGVDAGNFASKIMEGRFTWKRITGNAIMVGITVVSDIHDTAAASWVPNALPDGTEIVFTVKGAAGRTIDWLLVGEVGSYAPAGVSPTP